ncbi:vacuolar ATPase assembly integral membrane protein VMA21 homolog [Episyrphus balteatus]|uniref:vacuolar ATPase assembly integral membrane protein VMA21 homolog n=1 Tax=Episyrphus balteatus TaxID=286459 RepID=UPI002484F0F6|nr:vacuolar ATPase assembly integral membrane protein VMA21 homolog [Episyrphus balteatus]
MARTKSKQQSNDTKDFSSFKTVMLYCSFIVIFPIFTFFFMKSLVLDNLFVMEEVKSNIYSAVGAVVALHVGLGLYIYRAYFVTTSPEKDD